MALPQKKTSSSVDPEGEKSLFDADIGSEFLRSWKSMSVMEDDKLDFSFDTVTNGKKKALNFGKLDMDFELGGDFGKLSTFNVVMPDLDFPDSSKKAAKPKVRTEAEPSLGKHQGKKDSFSFSFDFNELDKFDFDSNGTNGGIISMMNLDIDGVVSNRTENQGSIINQSGSIDVFDDGRSEKPQASECVTTSIVETNLGIGRKDGSFNDNLHSKSGMVEDVVVSNGASSPENPIIANAEETGQRSCSPDGTVLTKPYIPQTTQPSPVQSPSKNDLSQDIVSDEQIDIGSFGTKVDIELSPEQTLNDRIVAGIELRLEGSLPKNLDPLHGTGLVNNTAESGKTDCEIPKENAIESKLVPDDSDLQTAFVTNLSQTVPQDSESNKDIENSTSNLLVILGREPVVHKIASKKGKESGVVGLKYFRRPDKPKHKLHHPSLVEVEVTTSGSKRNFAMQIYPENEKSEGFTTIDAQLEGKFIGDSKSPLNELSKDEPAFMISEKNCKTPCNIRESINGDGGRKLVVSPRPPAKKELPKGKHVLGSIMNSKNASHFGDGLTTIDTQLGTKVVGDAKSPHRELSEGETSFLGSEKNCKIRPSIRLTDKTTKSNGQTSEKSRVVFSSMGLMQNSKINFSEGLKAWRKTPAFSSLKISKIMGESKGQSNATLQREISFMEVLGNKASNLVLPLTNAPITSLKRKQTTEALYEDTSNPPKRVSLSSRENRNFSEHSESIVGDQVCDHSTQAGCTTAIVLCDDSFGHQTTQEVKMKDLKISLTIKNDGIVEKIEACLKELDGICNMLKKKHEEAKEIMVRAIVTNNNLLMLNHPIFDEKICTLEKFAAQLALK